MFKCEITGRLSKLGEKCNKIVVERRDRVYHKWVKNEETLRFEKVEVATGWEIVKELRATEEGLKLWNSFSPEKQAAFLNK